MRRCLHLALGLWFTATITLAQACVAPGQNSYSSAGVPQASSRVGGSGGYPAMSSTNSAASMEPAADQHFDTSGYSPDADESKALTSYLTQHKLPLVGAQVLTKNGERAVVLYGFVGSDYGKSDAAVKARRYLGDSSIAVDNRIRVRPELLAANRSSSGSPATANAPEPSGNSQYPGVQSYVDQQSQAEALSQYQSQGTAMGGVLPLVALLGMLSMGFSSGGSGFMIGGGGSPLGGPTSLSPFGYSPYNPYPGGSVYGSPFGPAPMGPSYGPGFP